MSATEWAGYVGQYTDTELRQWVTRHHLDSGDTGMAARGFHTFLEKYDEYMKAVDGLIVHDIIGKLSPEDFDRLVQEVPSD